MFHVFGVALAFLGAPRARFPASVERRAQYAFVRAGAARSQARGCVAKIGAIEIDTDTLAQFQHHVLAETRIGA